MGLQRKVERTGVAQVLQRKMDGQELQWDYKKRGEPLGRLQSRYFHDILREYFLNALREKCSNTDQKKFRIWTLFTQ